MMSHSLNNRLDRMKECAPQAAAKLIEHLGDRTPAPPAFTAADLKLSPAFEEWVQEPHTNKQAVMLVVIGVPSIAEYAAITRKLTSRDRVLIVEPSLDKALRFAQINLIENLLQQKRMGLALGNPQDDLKSTFFSLFSMRLCPSIRLLDTGRTSAAETEAAYAQLREVRVDMRLDAFNAGTLVCKGPLWQFNTLKNLPHIIDNPGILDLEGLFAGRPALVAGAGPGLDEAIPYLKTIAKRFVLISTGTALRPLRQHGIRPDLVIAVDGSHLIAPQFETACEDLFFACSSLVYAEIPGRFKGVFTGALDASPIDRWIDHMRTPRGAVYAGGTVTCSAMHLAHLMGCSPVCAVGLDLCFQENGITHADGTMYHGARCQPEAIVRVPGNYADTVPTTQQFQCYVDLVSDFVKKFPETEFININSGGARIDGMKLDRPERLEAYAGATLDSYALIEEVCRRYQPGDTGPVRDELNEVIEKLDAIIIQSCEAAELCNRVIIELRAPTARTLEVVRPLMEELMQTEEVMETAKESSVFIQMSLWPAFYEFGIQRDDDDPESSPDRTAALQRFRKLYEQIAGASTWTRDALRQVLRNWETDAPSTARTSNSQETVGPVAAPASTAPAEMLAV